VGTYHVAVLYCGNGGRVWGAMLDDCSAHDLASLRRALENHHFKAIVHGLPESLHVCHEHM
jgi:hypothetical protein